MPRTPFLGRRQRSDWERGYYGEGVHFKSRQSKEAKKEPGIS
jgi:hypothetical protein